MPFTGTGSGIQNANDVFFSGVGSNNVLRYNSSTSKWNNSTLAVSGAELSDGAVTDAKISTGISQSKISNLTSDLSSKAQANSTFAFIMYNGGYAARSTVTNDTSRVVIFIGPVAPTIGGNGAINNTDFWWNTSP